MAFSDRDERGQVSQPGQNSNRRPHYAKGGGKLKSRKLGLEALEGRNLLAVTMPVEPTADVAAMWYAAATAPVAVDDEYSVDQHVNLVVAAPEGVLINDTPVSAAAGSLLVPSYGLDNDLIITADTAGKMAGDLLVQFVADREGNPGLWAEYIPAVGDEPGQLNVHLQTSAWVQALYSSTGGPERAANSRFTVTATVGGDEFNGIRVVVINNNVGAGNERVEYDYDSQSLRLWINDGTTTANRLEAAFLANAEVSSRLAFAHVAGSDGNGLVTAAMLTGAGGWAQTIRGADGGAVMSTASQVVAMINGSPSVAQDFTATLAPGETGAGRVAAFEEAVHVGQLQENNLLQFIGRSGASGLRFVKGRAGESLRVDSWTSRPVADNPTAIVQGINANSTIQIQALRVGREFGGVGIQFIDNAGQNGDYVLYDARQRLLLINIDITGGTSANEVLALIAADSYVNDLFAASNVGGSDGTGLIHPDMLGGGNPWAVTSSGIAREGAVFVRLETDATGQVTTTAQDLVDYFNDASNAQWLQGLGMGVGVAPQSEGWGVLDVSTAPIEFELEGAPLLGNRDAGIAGMEAELVTGPLHGELELLPDGSFRYTPDYNFIGMDQFTYRVTAGLEISNEATVTLNVELTDLVDFHGTRNGLLYVRSLGTVSPATGRTELGFGTSIGSHRAVIDDLSQPSGDVFAGYIHPGELVRFSLRTEGEGRVAYAFSAAGDIPSRLSFTDYDFSLGMGGTIVRQVAPDVWHLRIDPAVGGTDREPLLIELRIVDATMPTNLGTVGQTSVAGINLTGGEIWYELETAHDGFLTLDTTFAGSGVETRLYSNRGYDLGAATAVAGGSRLDWEAMAGETYYVKLSGTGTNIGLRATNLLGLAGGDLSAFGTDGNDQFQFDAAGLQPVVINGVQYQIDGSTVRTVSYAGGSGLDSLTLWGTPGNEVADITLDAGTFTGTGLDVGFEGVENILINGRGGVDVGRLRDTSGDDVLEVRPGLALLAGTGLGFRLEEFEHILVLGSGEGYDTAALYDSAGNETFSAWPEVAILEGSGVYFYVERFDVVHANATAGGQDLARLYDSDGDDTFTASPTLARMQGDGYLNRARSFDQVEAHAYGAGSDTAVLTDSAGNDVFVANPDQAELSGSGFSNRAVGFDAVSAAARSGGYDTAALNDSPGDDLLVATPTETTFSGPGFSLSTIRFDVVNAYAKAGGVDVAEMYDSAGNDTFVAKAVYSRLLGDGFVLGAKFFDAVHAFANAGGSDAARFYGSAAADSFVGRPTWSQLSGNGYFNREKFFEDVSVYGDGPGDTAWLFGSEGDDYLYAAGSTARLSYGQRAILAGDFPSVTATSQGGTNHREIILPIDYVLTTYGTWIDV